MPDITVDDLPSMTPPDDVQLPALAEVRLGPDLVLSTQLGGDALAYFMAFDSDSNYLSTLAVTVPDLVGATLPVVVDTARSLYPVHAGLVDYQVAQA
jgi:hypothetical protein